MNLAAEFAAGFSEGAEPITTPYTLTNDPHRGVIRGTGGNVELQEPMLEGQSGLVIVEPVANFTREPNPEAQEVVQVLEGQFAGKWVLVACVADNAQYTLTCVAAE